MLPYLIDQIYQIVLIKRLRKMSLIKIWKSIRTEQKFLAIIISASILFRLAAAFYLGDTVTDLPGTFDQISYHNLAKRVLSGHGFTFGTLWWPVTAANEPTAHWSYIYTYYLVAVYRIFGIHPLIARLIQAMIVGFLHPWLIYSIGKKIFNVRAGLMAAALTAVYSYFIYYAATLMTEPFYISAILACMFFAIALRENFLEDRRNRRIQAKFWLYTLAIGFCLGAAILLRQLFLIICLLFFIWLIWSMKRKALLSVFVIGGILALCILPFTIFNYARFNRFVLLNTNAGFAFFWGNHPIYGTRFVPILPPEMGKYQDLIPPELLVLDEAALDQALLKKGLQFITADPVRYFYLSLSRIPVYFMFWPSADSIPISNISRLTSFGIMWPFMILGMFLVFLDWKREYLREKHKDLILIVGFMVIYAGIHILSWTLIRYRLPVDAIALIFAGVALEKILIRIGVLKKFTRSKDENIFRYTLRS
jgi:4-amino-4-deoxy-L-arabinose transferase-like glycosyltransferase